MLIMKRLHLWLRTLWRIARTIPASLQLADQYAECLFFGMPEESRRTLPKSSSRSRHTNWRSKPVSWAKNAVSCPAAIHPPCAKLAPACGAPQAGSFSLPVARA